MKKKLLKKLSRYDKNDFLQFSTFIETGIDKKEFYNLMVELEMDKYVKRVYELYSPFSHNSTGKYYESLKELEEDYVCDETDQVFTISPDDLKIKFKVKI